MRALVTGAAGFIGGAVARRLLGSPGLELVAMLDRERVAGGEVAGGRVAGGRVAGGKAVAIASDLTGLGSLDPATLGRPDLVMHCAGITAAACAADPDEGYRANVEGTRALLAWCRALPRPPRLVFTSSVAVFGGGEPVADEASRLRPNSTYGATKVMAEELVLDASRRGEVEGVIVRLPVTIVRPSRVGKPGAGFLSDLIIAAVEGRPFEAPLPVDRAIPVAGLRATVDRLVDLAIGPAPSRPVQHIPSLAATAEAVLAALASRGFESPQVRFRPDLGVEQLIAGWPDRLACLDEGGKGVAASQTLQELVDEHLRSRGLDAGAPPIRTNPAPPSRSPS